MDDLLDQRYQLLHKVSQLREKIGGRRMPKIEEPKRMCTHHDYMLEEMKWLSADFIEERKHKIACGYILAIEIKSKAKHVLVAEPKPGNQLQSEAKKIGEMVLQYFSSIDDGKREEEKPKEPEKVWQVADVNHSISRINIVLEKIELKPTIVIEPPPDPKEKPVKKYSLNMIHKYGFQPPEIVEKNHESPPSTPDTAAHENDFTSDFGSNLQMYYDIDTITSIDYDLRAQLENLHLEDIDIYAPLSNNEQEFREITHEEQVIDKELFMLAPDSEEFAIWEVSKRNIEDKSPDALVNLTRFQSEMYPFPNQSKKEWRIFEDMELEKLVYEFGGNWDLVADLMSISKHTTSDFYTADECNQRWSLLQKRKGRSVGSGFKPQPALLPTIPPIQQFSSNFSLFQRKAVSPIVYPKIEPNFQNSDPNEPLEFLLHNLNFENNYYFYHYQNINSKYYGSAPSPSFKALPKPELDLSTAFNIKPMSESEKVNTANPLAIIKESNLKLSDMTEISIDKQVQWSNAQQIASIARQADIPNPNKPMKPTVDAKTPDGKMHGKPR